MEAITAAREKDTAKEVSFSMHITEEVFSVHSEFSVFAEKVRTEKEPVSSDEKNLSFFA